MNRKPALNGKTVPDRKPVPGGKKVPDRKPVPNGKTVPGGRRRLRVDPIACDGRGLCAEVLPERITLDDWGFPIISDAAVTGRLRREAEEAVRLCPKLALRIEGPGLP